LQIDRDALLNNTLRIVDVSLIFQDGEIFKAPFEDTLPDPVDLSEIPISRQHVTYYAALPRIKNFGGNFSSADSSNPQARYSQSNQETADLFTQAVNAELSYLKKNVQIISEIEPRDSYISFPIVRLQRISTGGFEIDPAFVAPSLSIRSATPLFVQLRRLIDALQAKVNALYGHHREPNKNIIEFRSGDISSFWLLHTASTAYANLTHYFHHPSLHPERLYEQLLGLTGSLMAYSKTYSLTDLPAYNHLDPAPCFSTLYLMIRELLDTVISSKYFSIALTEVKLSYHHGMLDSGKIDEKTNLYLAIAADMPAAELVDVVPLRFKIGAPDDVEKFVLSAMPGVKLVHSPQVPASVPIRPDTYYFSIENKGPLYDRMLQAQSISIYVPSGIRDLKLELLAVTP
ncbi:MAG: type VI secretion system baseplate subunit TssK, partial [Burkholderiales bacterium]|nr:type VI secretion system baseplate subunit TssK [Burkholderiales bacterium]